MIWAHHEDVMITLRGIMYGGSSVDLFNEELLMIVFEIPCEDKALNHCQIGGETSMEDLLQ